MKTALVLGMVFSSAHGFAEALRLARVGTTVSNARDRSRLLQLERLGYNVISLSETGAVPATTISLERKTRSRPGPASPDSPAEATVVARAEARSPAPTPTPTPTPTDIHTRAPAPAPSSGPKSVPEGAGALALVEEGKHCVLSFGTRAVRTLAAWLALHHPEIRRVDAIYLDYVRFPPSYMAQAYTPFLTQMLPELVKRGLVDAATQVVVPNSVVLTPAIDVRAFSVAPLSKEEAPLYLATVASYAQHPEAYGGITLQTDFKNLAPDFPFVALSLRPREARPPKSGRPKPVIARKSGF